MSSRTIRLILWLGTLTVAGMIGIQAYFMYVSSDLERKEFNQKVMIGLRNVADSLALKSGKTLPGRDVVQKMSGNHYAVNINQVIDANLLEYYLFEEFKKRDLTYDFDYGIYDCFSDDFVFGNCCSFSGESSQSKIVRSSLPRYEDLNYYFVVSFPTKSATSHFTGIPKLTWLFVAVTLLAALFFIYAMSVILRQKRLSELQRDFINNMTHEFKTPISSIKLAIDGLRDYPMLQDNTRVRRYTEIISEQNERLNHQVEKVLNLAKSEVDTFELKKEPVLLNEFIMKILDQFQFRIAENEGELLTDISTHPMYINADKLHLANVIDTILDNSLKYCQQRPMVSVSLSKINQSAVLQISDNGIGIEKEQIPRIFNKFYRVPTGNVHDVKGFGLGLYYVKKIVREHQWNIHVESEPGQGSSFYINFPLTKHTEKPGA